MKILPNYTIEQESSWNLQTNKITFEPGEKVEVTLPEEEKEEISIGVSINEWYKKGKDELNDEYICRKEDITKI